MLYGIDLSRISIGEFRDQLKRQDLLPSRRPLLNEIDRHFAALDSEGIVTLLQLRQRLSTPKKICELAAVSGIPQEYLALLRRELGSLEQKPVLLADFPGTDPALLATLSAGGMRNSKDYWESCPAESDELYCLCDLVRINGVGAAAAKAFYAAGYRSAEEIAGASAPDMLASVSAANAQGSYYQAKLGEKDMRFCIDAARLLVRFSG